MSYVLETQSEVQRLEQQSRMAAYDYKQDLGDLIFTTGSSILDAGCGSGVVSRYLAQQNPDSKITGCDFSSARLQGAKELGQHISNLSFDVQNLQRLTYADNVFDALVCRYVLEHQRSSALKKVMAELHRVLRPSATIRIIDVDGCFFNLYPQSPSLAKSLRRIEQDPSMDLWIGRKLPLLLSQAGFTNISWRIETWDFKGQSLEDEVAMTEQRLDGGATYFAKVLGGKAALARFKRNYISALRTPGAVLFYNKFVVTAVKPQLRLQLLK